MAEYLAKAVETTIHINGVRIEVKADGAMEIYADSEQFNVTTRAGRAQNPNTGRLHTLIIIAPFLAPQTGTVEPPHAAPTQAHSNPLKGRI